MNVLYGSIHIKNVGKFIVPGNNVDERKSYCHNLLNSINGVFVPKLDEKYSKIIAIGTIDNYFILTVDGICDNQFDYNVIDGHISHQLLILESYFDDPRYKPRLEILFEILSIKIKINNMSDSEFNVLRSEVNTFMNAVLDLNDLEETKYEKDFDQKIYEKELIVNNENFNIKYNNLMNIAPYLRLYNDGSQLYTQYCLLSEFINFQKSWLGVLINSTYWLNVAMLLCGISEEIKSIRFKT